MISYSVVICTYNQKDNLQSALESLRRQIRNPKIYEVIITDDGSSDGTENFVKKQRYPIFLKYIRSESSLGRAANRNRGFQRACGQWIIFIDGDMIPSPNFIEAYHSAWNEFPDSVCIGSWRPPAEWDKIPYLRYLSTRGRLIMKRGERVPGKYFTSGNFSIRKDMLERLGGFDNAYKGWGGEDTDFGFRLEAKAIPIKYIPEASCDHFHQKTLDEVISEYIRFGQSGFPLLIEKFPDKNIFDNGWLLGLPGPDQSLLKRAFSIALWPLRSTPVLAILQRLAEIKQGSLFTDTMFDWLFYGHLAKGYKSRRK